MKKEKVMRNKTFPQTGADRHPEMAEERKLYSRLIAGAHLPPFALFC